jgi:hypothetical protein
MNEASLLRSIRIWLGVVIVGLVVSGVTAFPLQHEIAGLVHVGTRVDAARFAPGLMAWLGRVLAALSDTDARYPFLAYGTDWLAFAHLAIAVAFVGPYRDPVRNKWVVDWGLVCCVGVIPLALIAGTIRGIPVYWRMIDCSFGVFCCVPLLILRRLTEKLERLQEA